MTREALKQMLDDLILAAIRWGKSDCVLGRRDSILAALSAGEGAPPPACTGSLTHPVDAQSMSSALPTHGKCGVCGQRVPLQFDGTRRVTTHGYLAAPAPQEAEEKEADLSYYRRVQMAEGKLYELRTVCEEILANADQCDLDKEDGGTVIPGPLMSKLDHILARSIPAAPAPPAREDHTKTHRWTNGPIVTCLDCGRHLSDETRDRACIPPTPASAPDYADVLPRTAKRMQRMMQDSASAPEKFHPGNCIVCGRDLSETTWAELTPGQRRCRPACKSAPEGDGA